MGCRERGGGGMVDVCLFVMEESHNNYQYFLMITLLDVTINTDTKNPSGFYFVYFTKDSNNITNTQTNCIILSI